MALEVPAVVKAADPAKASRLVPPESTPAISKGSAKSDRIVSRPLVSTSIKRAGALPAANDDRSSAVVIARRPRVVNLPPGLLPETPDEHQRRGDAADAIGRELVRRSAEKS